MGELEAFWGHSIGPGRGLKPAGASRISTLEGNAPSIVDTIQLAEADAKNHLLRHSGRERNSVTSE